MARNSPALMDCGKRNFAGLKTTRMVRSVQTKPYANQVRLKSAVLRRHEGSK
jgi:uncharacterized protein YjhX (UPF0386 family)